MLLIGVSGPPRCGKGIFVNVACGEFGFLPISLSLPIKKIAHGLVGSDFPDEHKDEATAILGGHTPRDLYVHIGRLNEFIPTLWVRLAWDDQYEGADHHYIVDSVGTQPQWAELKSRAEQAGHLPCLVEIERPGYGWQDNRHRVSAAVNTISVINDGTIDGYIVKCREALRSLMQRSRSLPCP